MDKSKEKQRFIDVLGKPYLLEYKSNYECSERMGATSIPEQKIRVNKTTGIEQQGDTLLHEVIHIVDIELALGLPEETVRRLAVGLYSAGCKCKTR